MTPFDPARFAASATAASRLLKALANERRLMILCQLSGGEMTVGDLQARIGQMMPVLSQSALSQHLAVLRADGLVATRRVGQSIHYAICDPAAAQLMATLAAIFCPDDVETFHDHHPDQADSDRG